jgi:nucleotide-binding universal stress UspA family protein
MLQDILVHIPVEGPVQPVVDCSVSLASVFKANLTAVAFDYQFSDAAVALDGSVAAVAVQTRAGLEQADLALGKVAAAVEGAGISCSVRKIELSGSASETLARMSRCHDLTIIRQRDTASPGYDDRLAESVLTHSGRPILLVPHIFKGPLELRRVLICWDGGAAASRAVHDAMPFLRAAPSLRIVSLNEKNPASSEVSSRDLADHLARHGLTAEVDRFDINPSRIQTTILSIAADYGADLIVMGGYGHSRTRELLLGGVTRETFESLTVPALMSH